MSLRRLCAVSTVHRQGFFALGYGVPSPADSGVSRAGTSVMVTCGLFHAVSRLLHDVVGTRPAPVAFMCA